jgi:hypothetical protein
MGAKVVAYPYIKSIPMVVFTLSGHYGESTRSGLGKRPLQNNSLKMAGYASLFFVLAVRRNASKEK